MLDQVELENVLMYQTKTYEQYPAQSEETGSYWWWVHWYTMSKQSENTGGSSLVSRRATVVHYKQSIRGDRAIVVCGCTGTLRSNSEVISYTRP